MPAMTARATAATCNHNCTDHDPWGVNRASNTYNLHSVCQSYNFYNTNGTRMTDKSYKVRDVQEWVQQGNWKYYKSHCNQVYYKLPNKPGISTISNRCRNYSEISSSATCSSTGQMSCSGSSNFTTCLYGKNVFQTCATGTWCIRVGQFGTTATTTSTICDYSCPGC
jgi:Carbohydrate binding domain (family 19)